MRVGRDKKVHVAVHVGRHGVAEVENFGGIYRPQRDGDRFYQSTVPEQDQLRGAAAKVEDNTVLHGKSVDNADITQKRFCVTGNNMQVDSGSIGDFLYKPVSVFRIADGCRCYRNNFICLVLPAHKCKGLHDLKCTFESFFREIPVPVSFLCQTQGFLLVKDHVVRAAFIYMADDQPGRVGSDIDDCDSLHKRLPCDVLPNEC